MENILKFLIADSDYELVEKLELMISSAFPDSIIDKCTDGNQAWDNLTVNHPAIIIADISLDGLTGLEICAKLKEDSTLKDTYFLCLIDRNDKDKIGISLESGVDDYLLKPVETEEFVARLITATRFINLNKKLAGEGDLIQEFSEEIEDSIQDMMKLCVNFIHARIPLATALLKRVSDASVWIARKLDVSEEDIKFIEISAMLSYAGRMYLSDDMLKMPVMIDGQPSHTHMYQVPVVAKDIVSGIKRLVNVPNILYHIYENFDGTGFPDKLMKWQIPIGSRIIRVALDYEEARLYSQYRPQRIINELRKNDNRLYDSRTVTLMEQYLAIAGTAESDVIEKAVQFRELTEGMVLSRDVFTNSGLKLITADTVLSQRIIDRIMSHNTSDPILGNIIVRLL